MVIMQSVSVICLNFGTVEASREVAGLTEGVHGGNCKGSLDVLSICFV